MDDAMWHKDSGMNEETYISCGVMWHTCKVSTFPKRDAEGSERSEIHAGLHLLGKKYIKNNKK